MAQDGIMASEEQEPEAADERESGTGSEEDRSAVEPTPSTKGAEPASGGQADTNEVGAAGPESDGGQPPADADQPPSPMNREERRKLRIKRGERPTWEDGGHKH